MRSLQESGGKMKVKFSIELKEDRYEYEYEVGMEKSSGSSALGVDALRAFTRVLELARSASEWERQRFDRECNAKAYIEKHPELLKEQP